MNHLNVSNRLVNHRFELERYAQFGLTHGHNIGYIFEGIIFVEFVIVGINIFHYLLSDWSHVYHGILISFILVLLILYFLCCWRKKDDGFGFQP